MSMHQIRTAPLRVRIGELPGSTERPTEDRVVVLPHALVVLDGVSTVTDQAPRGGWYAGVLGDRIADLLSEDPRGDLRELLAEAIGHVVRDHGLVAGSSPAATVAIVRQLGQQIDAAVLGDSPIIALGTDATVHQLRDEHLARLVESRPQAREYRQRLRLGHGFDDRHRALLRELRAYQDTVVNRAGGYWIAEALPAAGRHARTATWPLHELDEVLVATDGAACAVDEYGLYTWPELAAACRTAGPQAVVDTVREVEEQDPAAGKWPRYKKSDDKALAHIQLTEPRSQLHAA
ncbi:hypothetical protein ABH940_003241 [Streptacidiphilus sp. BW17]|uniref:protein phosphatase 2C domain-containing protein n=1 Tax=unclassified Streptacidiphilus TaxID=2643834 RepID=UPI003517E7E1